MSTQVEPHTRPRVEGPREAEIFTAALGVPAAVGYGRLTMDAVAQRARASKATLYRRWNGKVSLVIDALHHGHRHEESERAAIDTGSLPGGLIAQVSGDGGRAARGEVAAFGAILAAIPRDAEFAEAFRREVLAPKVAGS